MFCIAIPLGLARENKGVAAFAGFVGYAVMNLAVNWLTNKGILPTTDAAVLKANNIQSIFGIQWIDTGILGAVIAGIIVWMLHERFHNIRLPDALALLGGSRSVPIISSLVMGLVGLVIPLVTHHFAMGISSFSHIINSAGDFGPMLFGTGERVCCRWSASRSGGINSLYRCRRHAGSLRSNRQRRIDHLPGAIELPDHSRFF